jgi:potassium voltage-gated channel Eag-related subfamily H protein 8
MQGKEQETQYACGLKNLRTGVVPSLWKKVIVVPILKADKDPTSTTSYRPISLTSTMGKTMERIINTRLNLVLETNNSIANEQAGFRTNRSTNEHIVKLSQFIKNALDNKRILTAVFVDFKSAYDSVWKENLLFKLIRSGIKSNLLNWFESFISHRA